MRTTMFVKIFSGALMVLLTAACSQAKRPAVAPEYLFNSEGSSVITSWFNSKMETMSILYGNEAALHAAGSRNGEHEPGEVYTLVTWKQQSHPFWFGSNLNEALTTIERVNAIAADTGKVQFRYEVVRGDPPTTPGMEPKRIEFILDQKASEFP